MMNQSSLLGKMPQDLVWGLFQRTVAPGNSQDHTQTWKVQGFMMLGFPKIRGPIFGSPYNESPTILGYILGPLIFGVSHVEA